MATLPARNSPTLFFCGESGIRTHDALLRHTHFPGAHLQPLGHFSRLHNRRYQNHRELPALQARFPRFQDFSTDAKSSTCAEKSPKCTKIFLFRETLTVIFQQYFISLQAFLEDISPFSAPPLRPFSETNPTHEVTICSEPVENFTNRTFFLHFPSSPRPPSRGRYASPVLFFHIYIQGMMVRCACHGTARE